MKAQINSRVNNLDFDKVTTEQLKKILEIIKNKLTEKIEEARKAREKYEKMTEQKATSNMTYNQFISS